MASRKLSAVALLGQADDLLAEYHDNAASRLTPYQQRQVERGQELGIEIQILYGLRTFATQKEEEAKRHAESEYTKSLEHFRQLQRAALPEEMHDDQQRYHYALDMLGERISLAYGKQTGMRVLAVMDKDLEPRPEPAKEPRPEIYYEEDDVQLTPGQRWSGHAKMRVPKVRYR